MGLYALIIKADLKKSEKVLSMRQLQIQEQVLRSEKCSLDPFFVNELLGVVEKLKKYGESKPQAKGAVVAKSLKPTSVESLIPKKSFKPHAISKTPRHEPPTKNPNKQSIVDCLANAGVFVETCHDNDPLVDRTFNKLAKYIGERQPILAPLLKQMNGAIHFNHQIRLNLKSATQQQIPAITSFCNRLYNENLLSEYHYSKKQKTINAVFKDRGDVKRFFTGGWFERFIQYQISYSLSRLDIPHSYLLNPEVKFPIGGRHELDLLFFFAGKLFLVECKTAQTTDDCFEKFSIHHKQLSIPSEQAFFVKLNVNDIQAKRLSGSWGFHVVNQHTLVPLIQKTLHQAVLAS